MKFIQSNCSVPNCERPHYCKKVCRRHYYSLTAPGKRQVLTKISNVEIEKIKADRLNGKTYEDIGAIYNVTGAAISNLFKRNKIKIKPIKKFSNIKEHLGYLVVGIPNRKTMFVHRLVMENILGRHLSKHEIVHHIDGNKKNNRRSNLELITSISTHMKMHKPQANGGCKCGNEAFIDSKKYGGLLCMKCFNHIRVYHKTNICSSKSNCVLH